MRLSFSGATGHFSRVMSAYHNHYPIIFFVNTPQASAFSGIRYTEKRISYSKESHVGNLSNFKT